MNNMGDSNTAQASGFFFCAFYRLGPVAAAARTSRQHSHIHKRNRAASRVLVFVMGAFAEMSEDVSGICDIIAHDLARTHVSYYNGDARRTKGRYRQRTQKAWGHTAHRGWARLLLDRARDLIIHGPAHRGANGAAMPTDEGDQDGHIYFDHPERRGHSAASNSNSN